MTTSARRLLNQLNQLNSAPLEDVALLPNDNPFEVHALLFGPRGTPYESGSFRLKLVYGTDYPAAPPKGYFLTKIYHPNVSIKGDICVNTLKRDWTPDVTVSHILMIIKCLLINPGPDSALNEDAGRLLMDSYAEFSKMATMWTAVHAIKVDKALLELDARQRENLSLSFRSGQDPSIEQNNILGVSNVNTAGAGHGLDADQASDSLAKKKIKTIDSTGVKKKTDAKKKTLKRL